MHPATALLVSSTDLNWVGLRAILAGWPEVHVIDDVQQREYAVPIAAREHPDLILVTSDLPGLQLGPLVRDPQASSPRSRVVMLGQFLELEAHSRLDDLNVAGFIQWKIVTPEILRLVIAPVREGERQVVGKEASYLIGRAPNGASIGNHRGVARK